MFYIRIFFIAVDQSIVKESRMKHVDDILATLDSQSLTIMKNRMHNWCNDEVNMNGLPDDTLPSSSSSDSGESDDMDIESDAASIYT